MNQHARRAQDGQARRKSILVVEDNRDELMIYTTVLGHHGYTILAASDFDTALRVAVEQQPDLVLVDVNLGDVSRDGCDLVTEFRANPATARIPVVAHTAFGDVYRRALETVGCDAIIHKPTSPHHLLKVIENLIGPPDPSSPGAPASSTPPGTPPIPSSA